MYRLHVRCGRAGEEKSFTWRDYRDPITAVHRQLGTPPVWRWDNLSRHLAGEPAAFAEENTEWLRVTARLYTRAEPRGGDPWPRPGWSTRLSQPGSTSST